MRAALIGAHRSPLRAPRSAHGVCALFRVRWCFRGCGESVCERERERERDESGESGSGDIGDSQLTRSVRCGDCSSRAERSCRRPRAPCSCRAPTCASHANMSNAVSESATPHATRSARCPLPSIRVRLSCRRDLCSACAPRSARHTPIQWVCFYGVRFGGWIQIQIHG